MEKQEIAMRIAGIVLLYFLVYYKRSDVQNIDDQLIYFFMFCIGITLLII